jgi:hypothetical protein
MKVVVRKPSSDGVTQKSLSLAIGSQKVTTHPDEGRLRHPNTKL